APVAAEREKLRAALERARELFIATRFAEARVLSIDAEAGITMRGEPVEAELLAELAGGAALGGGSDGFVRAARTRPDLKLDPARWSPDSRAGLERAQKARAAGPKVLVRFSRATLFVDGVRAAGEEVELPLGNHSLWALISGRAPVHLDLT